MIVFYIICAIILAMALTAYWCKDHEACKPEENNDDG